MDIHKFEMTVFSLKEGFGKNTIIEAKHGLKSKLLSVVEWTMENTSYLLAYQCPDFSVCFGGASAALSPANCHLNPT